MLIFPKKKTTNKMPISKTFSLQFFNPYDGKTERKLHCKQPDSRLLGSRGNRWNCTNVDQGSSSRKQCSDHHPSFRSAHSQRRDHIPEGFRPHPGRILSCRDFQLGNQFRHWFFIRPIHRNTVRNCEHFLL